MPCLCEYADAIFYFAMWALILLFIAAMALIQTKLRNGGDWPTPPKKGE